MILFIIQPFPSHLIPSFGLARTHKNKGERVVYTGTSNLRDLVHAEGFEFYEFEYLTEYVIRSFKALLGLFLKSATTKEFYEQRKVEFDQAFQNTKILIEEFNPNKVYLDQSIAEYYFFLKPFVDDMTILHTKFYSGKLKGIPPMNSLYRPKNTIFSNLICEWLWFRVLIRLRFTELCHQMAFLGRDEVYFWKKHCLRLQINYKKEVDRLHTLNRGVRNIEQIVLAPRELEFSTFPNKANIKFYATFFPKNETEYFSEAYINMKKKVISHPKGKIIFLAFGTLAQNSSKAENFFNQVLSLVSKMSRTSIIVSMGKGKMNLIHSKNSYIFDFVPQLDVLTYCDLFITHGGLGSVKEAYHSKVPMLVVPLNTKIDQPGNASRVKAAGLGERLSLDSYSEQELCAKLHLLLKSKNALVTKPTLEPCSVH